ncbi:MAG: hypothetical protein LBQ89_04785 [Treponema sp.]|jgi:DNA-directed RNA polymerase subunit RPC12/RpoP|nr:hypothetical protein [Treponema sp.]
MRKAIIIFLVLTLVGLSFVSCQSEPNYCPYCGSTGIIEVRTEPTGDKWTDYHVYKCSKCEKEFKVPIERFHV